MYDTGLPIPMSRLFFWCLSQNDTKIVLLRVILTFTK
jgi:hypothetical protein